MLFADDLEGRSPRGITASTEELVTNDAKLDTDALGWCLGSGVGLGKE